MASQRDPAAGGGRWSCPPSQTAHRTAFAPVEGNLDDALGRPREPAVDRADLVACALAAVDPVVVEAFLAPQFAIGPDAWRSPSGRAPLERSFEAVQGCADELAIPGRDPVGEI